MDPVDKDLIPLEQYPTTENDSDVLTSEKVTNTAIARLTQAQADLDRIKQSPRAIRECRKTLHHVYGGCMLTFAIHQLSLGVQGVQYVAAMTLFVTAIVFLIVIFVEPFFDKPDRA